MTDRTTPCGFRTCLAREDEFAPVLDTRRRAYAEVMRRAGLSDASLRDEFDELPHSRSYLLLAPNGELAGTVRASLYVASFDWATIPLSKYHPAEMARLVEGRIPAVQSSLLGVTPEFRHLGQFPSLSLIRAILGTAMAFGIDHIVTLIDPRPAKRHFWARIGWRPVEPPVPHPFSEKGALLIVGSVAESLQIARQSRDFHVLAGFTSGITNSCCFPEEV